MTAAVPAGHDALLALARALARQAVDEIWSAYLPAEMSTGQ